MTEQFPPPEEPTSQPINPEPISQTETLGETPGSGRKPALVIGGAAVAVAVVAGAAFAAVQVFKGDDNAAASVDVASAMPANTLAMAAVSLEPSQLVEAVNTLNKFPAFADNTDVDANGDVVGQVVGALIDEEDDSCGLTYEADFKPWLGSSAGMGIIPEADGTISTDSDPRVFAVLETLDADKAQAAFDKFSTCSSDSSSDDSTSDEASFDDPVWSFVGDYAVLAENQENLDLVTAGINAGTLAESDTFNDVMGTAGDAGFASFYASPALGPILGDLAANGDLTSLEDDFGSSMGGVDLGTDSGTSSSEALSDSDLAQMCDDMGMSDAECEETFGDLDDLNSDMNPTIDDSMVAEDPVSDFCPGASDTDAGTEQMKDMLASFPGAAAVARFNDGGLEFQAGAPASDFAGFSSLASTDTAGGANVASLPSGTGLAFGLSIPDGWLDSVEENLKSICGPDFDADKMWAEATDATGLDLPTDLGTLLGNSISVSMGADLDLDSLSYASDPLTELPLGIKINGDTAGIQAVLQKLIDQMPAEMADYLTTETNGDYVVISPNADFRSTLAGDGGLGDTDEFKDVIPNADKASFVFFANANAFDDLVNESVDGMEGMMDADDINQIKANFAPLKAMGYSAWGDDDGSHLLFRLSTD